MSIKDQFTVDYIQKRQCKSWLLHKHYARRVPSIVHAFGLFDNRLPIGICTFGIGANGNLNELGGFQCIELNRLCVNANLPANALSFFVASCLKMLPAPKIVISYADTGAGHHGYIYQATNWIYTGLSGGDYEFIKNGNQYHRKTLFDMFGSGNLTNAVANGFQVVKVAPKHRYMMFIGDKRQKMVMKKSLPFKQEPYPKGDNARYDASYEPQTQAHLF